MVVVETLLAAKAAVGVGKGVMNWLDAKNSQFRLTPEERRARNLAARQAKLGMGGESFQNASNIIQSSTADASRKVRANAFAAGLENSGVSNARQQSVQNLSSQQLAELALKIADRNAQFRETASARSEQINMRIGEAKRQFNENRDARMKAAAFQTVDSLFNFAIKGTQAKQALDAQAEATELAKSNAAAGEIIDSATNLIEANDKDGALDKLEELANLEFDVASFQKTLQMMLKLFRGVEDE